jgi:hypothetical protein
MDNVEDAEEVIESLEYLIQTIGTLKEK